MKAREKQYPAGHQRRLAEAADRLIRLYDAWEKPDKAAEWRAVKDRLTAPEKKPTTSPVKP